MPPLGPHDGVSRLATEGGGVGVFEWNPVTRALAWDDAAARIFSASADEAPLGTLERRVHPEDREHAAGTFARFEPAEGVFRFVLDDGCVRHVLMRATHVLRDADGSPRSVVGVLLDVTDAHEGQARLAAILESISDGFIALDTGYRITYTNASAERMLGYPRTALLGRELWEVFPAGRHSAFGQVYGRVMRGRQAESFEEYYPEPLRMWIEVRAEPAPEGIVVYFRDVTERRTAQTEREQLLSAERAARVEAERAHAATEAARRALAHQATHDALTGLLNRGELERRARAVLARPGALLTAAFIDIDRFKLVNDTLGHAAGDELLVQLARRLAPLVGADDVLARLGGDEFVLLLPGHRTEEVEAVAHRLLEALRQPAVLAGRTVTTSASIGLATSSPGSTVQTLLRDADIALYRAKDNGRDRVAWFDAAVHRDVVERIALETDLRASLGTDELRLHYQPIHDLATRRVVGVEALARWRHPRRGDVHPAQFIPVAEETGLIRELGAQVVRLAAAQAAAWASTPDLTVWVNVSAHQLGVPHFVRGVLHELSASGVDPRRFGIEVTESVFMESCTSIRDLDDLAGAGVRIAIDDFGTGYSSLARLNALPVHVLKIDKSFVHELHTARGQAAVQAIVQLAHAYGLETIAEGVETPEQLELVRAAGSDAASGYLLGRPAPPAARPGGPPSGDGTGDSPH